MSGPERPNMPDTPEIPAGPQGAEAGGNTPAPAGKPEVIIVQGLDDPEVRRPGLWDRLKAGSRAVTGGTPRPQQLVEPQARQPEEEQSAQSADDASQADTSESSDDQGTEAGVSAGGGGGENILPPAPSTEPPDEGNGGHEGPLGQPPEGPESLTPPSNNREQNRSQEPSPVPGLTYEEVELLLANGESLVSMQDASQKLSSAQFRAVADQKLAELRGKKEELSLEEISKEREKRKSELLAERDHFQRQIATNLDEERFLQMSRMRVEQELRNLEDEVARSSAEGNGGGDGHFGVSHEEMPEIPDDLNLEYESSPERGLQITRGISEQTGLLWGGKIEKVDWPKLKDLYFQQTVHIEAQRLVRARVKVYEAEEDTTTAKEIPKFNKEAFKDARRLEDIVTQYHQEGFSEELGKEIDTYFAEAERLGLINDLKVVLRSAEGDIRRGIGRNLNSTEMKPIIDQKLKIAIEALLDVYRHKRRTDNDADGISRLEAVFRDPRTNQVVNRVGIWDLYAQFAIDRFETALNYQDISSAEEGYLDHEYRLGEEEDSEETYWRSSHGWYTEVFAQTEEEYKIAADSYLSRLQATSTDPTKILQDATQFIDVINRSDAAVQGKVSQEFLLKLFRGMYARLGVFGADHSNELYHSDFVKQYLDFINKDGEGPDRYLELLKILGAVPAAALFKLDKDPRYEVLFSLHGPRGELAGFSPAQRARDNSGLYFQMKELLVEEMLGVELKNEKNLENITKLASDAKYVSNFDGLFEYGKLPEGRAYGDANIKAYKDALAKATDGKLTPVQLRNRKIRLGKIQEEREEIAERITRGQKFKIKWGKQKDQDYDPIKNNINQLLESESDAKFYAKELKKTEKAVDIALEIYGTFGENSKRGGGVLKTAWRGEAGKEYQYFIPIHQAEKFAQTAASLTKIEYADDAEIWKKPEFAEMIKKTPNFKATYRTKMVELAIQDAIDNLYEDGYEAKLYRYDYDVKGNKILDSKKQMILKRPKEDAQGNVVKENGNVVVEKVGVDFYTAIHSIYANWSGHTYWSYQEEDRHMIVSDAALATAKKIRDGELRAQDVELGADLWAVQRLVLDPTLKRIRRFSKHFEDRERKLTMAAVQDSYDTHWYITNELYRKFWPRLGTPTEAIGVYYGLQDFGGYRKTVEHIRARIAEDPERFARRGRRLLPDLHVPLAPWSEYLGQGVNGILAALITMNSPVYRGAGTMALDKFSDQTEVGGRQADALLGSKDREGNFEEGLLLKLTNNSDKTRALIPEVLEKFPVGTLTVDPVGEGNWDRTGLPAGVDIPDLQIKFAYGVMESLGREKKYLQLFTLMETVIRNANGAISLKNIDIETRDEQNNSLKALDALPDINKETLTRAQLKEFLTKAKDLVELSEKDFNERYNRAQIDEDKSPKTGTGRINAKIFHDIFGLLLVDLEARGGVESYKGEQLIYDRIFDKMVYWVPDPKNPKNRVLHAPGETIWDFIFGKFVPT